MNSIFVSYRREDAEGQAGRLYNDLVREFGAESVFMDVAAIQFGRDFRKAIDQSLSSCGAFLSVIGKTWLTAKDASGQRRLDDPADFVRLETAAALQRDIPVIPVLVQGASNPKADQLPGDLKELAYRNAIELTHPRWDSDVQLLIKALRPYTSSKPKPDPDPNPPPKNRWSAARTVAPITLILAAIIGLAVYFWPAHKIENLDSTAKTDHKLADPDLGLVSKRPPAKKTAISESKVPLGEAMNAPARPITDPAAAIRKALRLLAEQKPLEQQANRYRFTLWIKAPEETLANISRVHYDLNYAPNSLSMEGGPPPNFSTVYEGWGCYTEVVVSVYLSTSEAPIKKTFNMCTVLGQ